MTPVERLDWHVKMKAKGRWKEIFNSDLKVYWGTNHFSNEEEISTEIDTNKQFYINIHLPPLAGIVLKKIE